MPMDIVCFVLRALYDMFLIKEQSTDRLNDYKHSNKSAYPSQNKIKYYNNRRHSLKYCRTIAKCHYIVVLINSSQMPHTGRVLIY